MTKRNIARRSQKLNNQ